MKAKITVQCQACLRMTKRYSPEGPCFFCRGPVVQVGADRRSESQRLAAAMHEQFWQSLAQLSSKAGMGRDVARLQIRQWITEGRVEEQNSSPVSLRPNRLYRWVTA